MRAIDSSFVGKSWRVAALAGVLVLSLLSSTALAHDIVYFEDREKTVEEGLQVNLKVKRCCHGSGSASVDYDAKEDPSQSGSLNFSGPIADDTVTFRSPAADDVADPVDVAHVELSNPKGSPAPIITSPRVADVLILDTDGPSRVAFASSQASVYSNRDFIELTVVRLGNDSSAATVGFSTAEGSAKAGEHFKAKSGTLKFEAGKRRPAEPMRIQIINNFKEKDNTEFSVTLDTAADPSAGPNEVAVEIRNLQTGDYAKPFTDFHIPKDGATYPKSSYKAKEAHIYSDDRNGSGVKVVKLAVRKLKDGGGCEWWNGSRWKRASCDRRKANRQMKTIFAMKKKPKSQNASTFTIFRLPHLKPSRGTKVRNYRTISRATDFSANIESYFRKGFNIRTFKIRK